LEGEIRERYL
jgi:hypothetical protein